MDGDQFDDLVRTLSSRRSALGGLVGSGVAMLLRLAGPDQAAAHNPLPACRRIKDKRKRARCIRRARRHNATHQTPPPPPPCTPNCAGKSCGSDGCSGSCGSCSGTTTCVGGTCQTTCTPNCAGKNCGSNGCGGSCGTCSGGQVCSNPANGGICQSTCTPSCAGKNCGSNGCGGSCGTCTGGLVCSNPANGGTCQCPAVTCGGNCCAGGQQCFGTACWPDSEEMAFVTLINNHRAANGLSALTLQNQLGAAAELHSQDQATNSFSSHTGSDGSSPDQRITRAGYAYSWWGENIYWGGGTASEAFTWWRNSPSHNANMLSSNFTQLGIGRARSSAGVWYWTTTFGRPR